MKKEEFEAFLASLNLDRDRAGETYEQIRRTLLTIFRGRGLTNPEDAADEVFNRCARRSLEGGIENIKSFILGVARKVASEIQRKTRETPLNEPEAPRVNPVDRMAYEEEKMAEIRLRCLRRGLGLLVADQRELLLAWYLYDKGEKIENRKRLAAQRMTTVETIKGRVHRARVKVQKFFDECMKKVGASFGAAI